MDRVERIGDQDGHAGNAEYPCQHAEGVKRALNGDIQAWAPAENGEGGLEAFDQVLLGVEFHPTPPGQEGQKGKQEDKAPDEDPGPRHFLPFDTRSENHDQGDCQKKGQETNVPEE